MHVRWTSEATSNLDLICSRIADGNPSAALDVGRTLFQGILRLSDFPHRGRTGLRQGTRELVFSPLPYIAVYRAKDEAVAYSANVNIRFRRKRIIGARRR